MTHSAILANHSPESHEHSDFGQACLNAAKQACQRIAPLWPLDQSIAVNPWWPLRQQNLGEVAAKLDVLGRVRCFMPKDYYKKLWQEGLIQASYLALASHALELPATTSALVAYLDSPLPESHWMNVSDMLDAAYVSSRKMPWHDEIIYQISQFCGGFFQHPASLSANNVDENSLYRAWLKTVRQDKGIEILMGKRGLNALFKALPEQPEALIVSAAMTLLDDQSESFADYCHALLLDINGWASWLAYQAWQDQFEQKPQAHVLQILAIRLAWDLVLWRFCRQNQADDQSGYSFEQLKQQFKRQWQHLPQLMAQHQSAFSYLSIWQRAFEFAYQLPLQEKLAEVLSHQNGSATSDSVPTLQAVFCIDVRSEPMRRALEAQHAQIQTFGFAGFFGLPIDYSPEGSSYARPQLPGLLKPAIRAVQRADQQASEERRAFKSKAVSLRERASFQHSLEGASSSFGLIEAQGLFKAFKLLKKSLFVEKPQHTINDLQAHGRWQLSQAGVEMDSRQLADLAGGILNALGLTENFAPVVLLFGHGSCSSNNPSAAALDCGACGGQTGEVNVKVLAQLLNDTAVRAALEGKGIHIPEETCFVAGLHNTTTDALHCFGLNESQKQADWYGWLAAATEQAQTARLDTFDLKKGHIAPGKVYQQRARDWAQTRPEWGLADNAAFIVAPRHRTRPLNLQGRSFLHDYDWRKDRGFGVLELIMTAPMVVTNWINLQYYASVTDNLKYGSGNKLLHNVVGGHIGVFEGNSGDLRGGLALQSVHDGKQWRHQPLRLSVYIEAPREAIEAIIRKHADVAHLVNNQWLFLFQLDDGTESDQQGRIWQWHQQQWHAVPVVKDAQSQELTV